MQDNLCRYCALLTALSFYDHHSIAHIYTVMENSLQKGTFPKNNKLAKPPFANKPKSMVIITQDKEACGHKVKISDRCHQNVRRHHLLGKPAGHIFD